MTSQGTAHGRFTRAIAQRNLAGAEIAAKELGGLSLHDALDYLVLLAAQRPGRAQAAALRWHGRFELETSTLTFVESQLGRSPRSGQPLRRGYRRRSILQRLLRRVRPTALPRIA